jgi:CRISPR-associated protein Csd2
MSENKIPAHLDPSRRQEALLYFSHNNGNPNGDPANGNMPRISKNGKIRISNGSLKRKMRSYVEMFHSDDPRVQIYMNSAGIPRARIIAEAYKKLGITVKKPQPPAEVKAVEMELLRQIWDTRVLGATSSMNTNGGSPRGAWAIGNAYSLHAVSVQEMQITCNTPLKEEDLTKGSYSTFGSKFVADYGLYKTHCFYSPSIGKINGVTSFDMELLYASMLEMFSHHHTANYGESDTNAVIIFTHSDGKGVASPSKLFNLVKVECAVEEPTCFEDYTITVDTDNLPEGVVVTILGMD